MKEECVSDFVRLKGKVYPCPLSLAMDLVGGKWKAVILYHLQDGAKRFAELLRASHSKSAGNAEADAVAAAGDNSVFTGE